MKLASFLSVLTAVSAGSLAAESAAVEEFHYRFYSNANCDHSAPAISTWPRNNLEPFSGSQGSCYSAPTGTDWQRLEIDKNFGGTNLAVITFCNVQCQGRSSALQRGTHCFVPTSGCAIGSFLVAEVVN